MSEKRIPPEVRVKPFSNVYITTGNDRIKNILMRGFDACGGIQKIVKPGQSVLIKVNLVEGHEPITGGITDVRLAEAVIELLKEHCQPGHIVVGENTNTGTITQAAFERDGWVAMCKRQDVELQDFEYHERVEINMPDAMYATKFTLPKAFVESDVVITLPMLKNHDTVCITGAIKNSFGCVPDLDRRQAHRDDAIEQFITDIARARKADFCIVDGRIGVEGIAGGAFFEHSRYANRIIMGADPVAVDVVCAHIMEQNPRVRYLQWCDEYGIGNANLDYINILGMPLEEAKVHFMSPGDEIEEFTNGKIRLFDLGSCSQCRAVAQGTLHRFRSEESVISNVDIVYGPGDWDIPENRAEKCLLVGDCIQERYRGMGEWIPGCPMVRDDYIKALANLDIVCNRCANEMQDFIAKHTKEELAFLRICASGKTIYVGEKNHSGDLDSVLAVGQCEDRYGMQQVQRATKALQKLGIADKIDPNNIVGSTPWHGAGFENVERVFQRLKKYRAEIDAVIEEAKAKQAE